MDYISSLPSLAWQNNAKRLTLLGSTGSIGRSTLNVLRKHPSHYTIIALAGGRNIALLAEQANEFLPPYLAIQEEKDIDALIQNLLPEYKPTILYGDEGYRYIASLPEVDTVLSAQVGASGLQGTYSALAHGKVVALANKESIVLAGRLLRSLATLSHASILPIDSEHSAIFQALSARPPHNVHKVILTASGGSCRGKSYEEMSTLTVHEALQHPTWNMGAKITIDSATMMNKGLEVIEAHHLFGIDVKQIEAIIHPQSIIHSLVEFTDATQIAQLSYPSMELAIAYALFYPYSKPVGIPSLNLSQIGQLTFEEIPTQFRCYYLARECLQYNNEAPIILNGANEIAVDAFLQGKITLVDIPSIIEEVLATMNIPLVCTTIEEIIALDKEARIYAQEYTMKIYKK